MREDFWFDSCGAGRIRCRKWMPEGQPRAMVQILHGIAEHVERYDHFAEFLNSMGFGVVAEDHMGHGKSINGDGVKGYFHGGWMSAVADSMTLMKMTMEAHPGVPCILFGHSMGSFMARTILCKYPDSGISAAIICGTGWQPTAAMPAVVAMMKAICARMGEKTPSNRLNGLIFGTYNNRVEHQRTSHDWLSRDEKIVDAYLADPLCGFVPSCGLLRDMMEGISFIQQKGNLAAMRKDLPVFFIAGGDDPVGSYGKGVYQAAEAFRKAGMTDVSVRVYPLCRHEILNEINREEIYEDVSDWIAGKLK